MRNLNDDDIPAPKSATHYVPWRYVEKAAAGDEEAKGMIKQRDAQKLVEERELAYRYNESIMT